MVSNLCPCREIPEAIQKSAALAAQQQELISYSDCCQPLHQGVRVAEDSETLMRSRYAAFVKVLPDYIIQTTLPDQQSWLDRQAITEWAEQTDWAGLQIIDHSKLSKRHAQVEFKAIYNNLQLGTQSLEAHHELSTFVKVKQNDKATTQEVQNYRWYFLDPTTSIQLTQKQPCICGSGQKFKRCCGQFL